VNENVPPADAADPDDRRTELVSRYTTVSGFLKVLPEVAELHRLGARRPRRRVLRPPPPGGTADGAGYAAGNRLVDTYLAAAGRTAAQALHADSSEIIAATLRRG